MELEEYRNSLPRWRKADEGSSPRHRKDPTHTEVVACLLKTLGADEKGSEPMPVQLLDEARTGPLI